VRVSTLGASLTERDAALLRELAVCRYLQTEQIHRAFFGDATVDRASQRMRELATRGLVRRVRYAHDGVHRFAYWHLSALGLTVCETLMPVNTIPHRSERDIRLRPHFLRHCVDVAEVRIQLQLLVKAGQMREYCYLTAGRARVELDSAGRVERATPDALIGVEMRWPHVWYAFWLEIDEGSMTRRAIVQKAERIHRLLVAHDHKPQAGHPWLRSRSAVVVLVCDQPGRRAWLEEVFRGAGFTGHGHPQIWPHRSPQAAAQAIAAAICAGDRTYAEQERREAGEAAAQRERQIEQQKVERMDQARRGYALFQQAWAEKQYREQGLFKRKSIDDFRQEFERTHPFSSV